MAVSRCEGDCAAITRKAMRVLRTTLKATGIHDSWTSLRNTLEVQRRVTTRLRRADGQTIHVQKNAREPVSITTYKALGITAPPVGVNSLPA